MTFLMPLWCPGRRQSQRVRRNEESTLCRPDLGAAVLEELQELGDHDVERAVQGVAVQQLGGILADLLQGSKRALCGGEAKCIQCEFKIIPIYKADLCVAPGQSDLAGVVVLRIEKVAELREQLGPRLQLPFGGDGRDEDALEKKKKDK